MRWLQLKCPHCKNDLPLRLAAYETGGPMVHDPDKPVQTVKCKRCCKISVLTGRLLGYTVVPK